MAQLSSVTYNFIIISTFQEDLIYSLAISIIVILTLQDVFAKKTWCIRDYLHSPYSQDQHKNLEGQKEHRADLQKE